MRWIRRFSAWLDAPMPVLRLEIIRIFSPLFTLGFMSHRIAHADEWLGAAGFRVPLLPGDPRQPLWVPPLSAPAVWAVVAVLIVSGLLVSAGVRARAAAVVFACALTFVALSDPPAAFTVSKIAPVFAVAVALGPAGTLLGVDAWRRASRPPLDMKAPLPSVRFLQLMLCTFYCASGFAKAGGDWLTTPGVLYTHLHDSYQTAVSFWMASSFPTWVWTPLQVSVLVFEALAPLWFGWRRTRPLALLFGLGMHTMIGVMLGPVVWFSLLMMALLVACFAPDSCYAAMCHGGHARESRRKAFTSSRVITSP